MSEFHQRANKLLRKVPETYRAEKPSIVDLISEVTRKGSQAADDLSQLKSLAADLEELQHEFVSKYDNSCNQSIERFVQLRKDLNATDAKMTQLKQKVLRLHNSMGGNTQDLMNLFKRKQRNKYLLQILTAVKDLSRMESVKEVLLAGNKFLQCANLMRKFKELDDQWPIQRAEGRNLPELIFLKRRLDSFVSPEEVEALSLLIKNKLQDLILRKSRLATPEAVAAIMEDTTEATAGEQKSAKLHVQTNLSGGFEQVAVCDFVQLWNDDSPLLTAIPDQLVNAKLLRGPCRLPSHVITTVRSLSQKMYLYVAYRPGLRDGDMKVASNPSWTVCPGITITTVGDFCSEEDYLPGPGPPWVVYRSQVDVTAAVSFPALTAPDATVLMFLSPQEDEESLVRGQCVAALHALGPLLPRKGHVTQLLLDTTEQLLQPSALVDQYADFLERFLQGYCAWRQKNLTAESDNNPTSLLTALRDWSKVRAAPRRDGTPGTLNCFEFERRLAEMQAPLIRQLFQALFGELHKVLDNYACVMQLAIERCFPACSTSFDTEKNFVASRCQLNGEELSKVARLLSSEAGKIVKTSNESTRQMLEVAAGAARLLEDDKSYSLRGMTEQRVVEGWLGTPPPKTQTHTLHRSSIEDDLGLVMDEVLRVTACRPQTAAQGLERLVGYRVSGVKKKKDECRTRVTTPEEFHDAIRGLLDVEVTCTKRHLPPSVSLKAVHKQVREACRAAGRSVGATDEEVAAAVAHMSEWTSAAVKGLLNERFSKQPLRMDMCWKILQSRVAPLLEKLCSPAFGADAGDGKAEAVLTPRSSSKEPQVLGELLEVERFTSGDKYSKLLAGAPKVVFFFGDPLQDEQQASGRDREAPTTGDVAEYIACTPFNILTLSKAVFAFEQSVLRRHSSLKNLCILGRTMEMQVNKELLPKLKLHYADAVAAAMDRFGEPVFLDDGGAADTAGPGKDPPVLLGVLSAARGVQQWFRISDLLACPNKQIPRDAEDVLQLLIDKCAAQLEQKTEGMFCGAVVIPLMRDVLRVLGSETESKLQPATRRTWRVLSMTPDERNIEEQVKLLKELQNKQRDLEYVRSSQDLSYLCSMAHSLEWLADQVGLHCVSSSQNSSELGCTENVFLWKTDCFETAVPGVDEAGTGLSPPRAVPRHDEDDDSDYTPVPHPPDQLASTGLQVIYRKLIALSRAVFFVLQIDLFTRCSRLLDSRDTYDHTHNNSEPSEFVEIFNRDIRHVHVTYSQYLPRVKGHCLLRPLPVVVSSALIRAVVNLKNKLISEPGVGRLQRNVFALQQNLALLVTDVAESDYHFVRVRRFYELFSCTLAELPKYRGQLEELDITYDDEEFGAVQEVVWASSAAERDACAC